MSSLGEQDAKDRGSLSLSPDSGFSAQEIADCKARNGLLSMVLELSPVLTPSPIADAWGFNRPAPAALSKQEICEVVRQAHELGARRIMLLSDPTFGSLEREVATLVRELGMELETGPRHPGPTPNGCVLQNSPTGQGCMRHVYSCVVSTHGQVFPCVGVLVPLGNVRDESLRDILRLSEVIENLANHRKMMKEPCRDCRDAQDCYGCRGAAFMATGDYLAPDPTCPRVQGVPIDSLPQDVAPLIPHGSTMQMVNRLMQVGERQAMGEFFVSDTCPFVDADGSLDATAYVELMVQTLAACSQFHRSADEQTPHRGLLLGINNLQITGESRVGDHLIIHVRKTVRFGAFGVMEGVVYHRDGRELARGETKVWQADSDSAGVFG